MRRDVKTPGGDTPRADYARHLPARAFPPKLTGPNGGGSCSPDAHDLAQLDEGGAQALEVVDGIARQVCVSRRRV